MEEPEKKLSTDPVEQTAPTVKRQKSNYYISTDYPSDLLDTPINDEEKIESILEGIIQNIYIEMEKQGISLRGLGELSGVNYSHLSRMFNGQAAIGMKGLIKIAYALHVSPGELFPYDSNKRKTNGQHFDEITKEMDIASCNYLLKMCTDYVKEWRRIKNNHSKHFDK